MIAIFLLGILSALLGWIAHDTFARKSARAREEQRLRCENCSTAKLASSHAAELEAVLDASPFGIIVADQTGLCIKSNQTLSDFLDLTTQAIAGNGWLEASGWKDPERLLLAWKLFVSQSQLFNVTLEYQRTPAQSIWVRVQVVTPRSQRNDFRAVVTFEDVTTEVRAKTAEAAGMQTKNEFLANVSHEIRTPMNAIIATADLALGETISDSCRESFEIIKDAGKHLSVLMTDILDFSKLEAGKVHIHSLPFSPTEAVTAVLAMCEARAHQKGIALSGELDADLPAMVIGDDGRLKQILLNLIGNAIKFTPTAGTVVIRGYICEETEEQLCLEFSVEDTGIGIEPHKLEIIFDPFQQGDTSLTREFGGTGLGLAICRQLARLMSGDIFVESEVGAGSIFTVQLHVAKVTDLSEALPSETIEPSRPNTRIKFDELYVLVVEDNPINQKVIIRMFDRWGIRYAVAANGVEAIDMYRESMDGEEFSMIFMDCQMPKVSGYDASKEIRRLGRQGGKRTPIIAMTAFAMDGDKEICLAAGMDDYLAKPLKVEQVMAAISRWSRRQRRSSGQFKMLTSQESSDS